MLFEKPHNQNDKKIPYNWEVSKSNFKNFGIVVSWEFAHSIYLLIINNWEKRLTSKQTNKGKNRLTVTKHKQWKTKTFAESLQTNDSIPHYESKWNEEETRTRSKRFCVFWKRFNLVYLLGSIHLCEQYLE